MRRNIIISLVLIGLLAFGIGFGTFAWFTANVKSEGNQIITGTLTLNGGTDVDLGALIDVNNQQPGVESEEKILTLTNSGSLPMFLRGKLTGTATGGNNPSMGDMYLKVNYVKLGDAVILDAQNGSYPEYIPFSEFSEVLNQWLPHEGGNGPFNPGQTFTLKFQTFLSPEAGNEWQGVTMTGNLYVEARQAVAGAEFSTPAE